MSSSLPTRNNDGNASVDYLVTRIDELERMVEGLESENKRIEQKHSDSKHRYEAKISGLENTIKEQKAELLEATSRNEDREKKLDEEDDYMVLVEEVDDTDDLDNNATATAASTCSISEQNTAPKIIKLPGNQQSKPPIKLYPSGKSIKKIPHSTQCQKAVLFRLSKYDTRTKDGKIVKKCRLRGCTRIGIAKFGRMCLRCFQSFDPDAPISMAPRKLCQSEGCPRVCKLKGYCRPCYAIQFPNEEKPRSRGACAMEGCEKDKLSKEWEGYCKTCFEVAFPGRRFPDSYYCQADGCDKKAVSKNYNYMCKGCFGKRYPQENKHKTRSHKACITEGCDLGCRSVRDWHGYCRPCWDSNYPNQDYPDSFYCKMDGCRKTRSTAGMCWGHFRQLHPDQPVHTQCSVEDCTKYSKGPRFDLMCIRHFNQSQNTELSTTTDVADGATLQI